MNDTPIASPLEPTVTKSRLKSICVRERASMPGDSMRIDSAQSANFAIASGFPAHGMQPEEITP
ncbi:hypothetical protein [Paraburkholderia atlantica]|uniref:hypothetical protein n=1 Tax=Paraburkholderia atlantica TaxID=2654982 RepID=UPI0012FEFFE0|nr:hypothetical protein [Paraburkholderia atlantica]